MQNNAVDLYGGPGSLNLGSVHLDRPSRPTEAIKPISGSRAPDRSSKSTSRRRLACKSCRQAKIKCDPSPLPAGRCKRCLTRNEDCRVDADFQRVHKKQTAAQLQEQIDRLNSVLGKTSNQITSNYTSEKQIRDFVIHRDDDVGPSHPVHLPTSLNSDNTDNTPLSTWRDLSQTGNSSPMAPLASRNSISPKDMRDVPATSSSETLSIPRKIGDVSIDGEDVNQLFEIFFKHYHPFLRLLDPSLSPAKCYDYSVLLFWSIITVASRHYASDPTLITSLAIPVTALLWKNISSPPHTIDLVQAIVLMTTWPFPTSSMHTDPSLTIISIAKATALTLGLHRPETVQDFLRVSTRLNPKEIQEAVKTWAGCYIAAQSVTSSIGHQPLFTVDWAIDRACQTGNLYELPEEIRHRLLIQQFSSYVSQVMSENRQNPTGLPSENEIGTTLAFLERGFEDLQRQLDGNLTINNQIMLCCACLQLRAFYFFETSHSRQRGLLKSYTTALSLIEMTEKATEKSGFMIYAPAHFGHMMFTAGVTVLKILHSSFSTFVDFARGKRAFNSVITLCRRASIEDNDLPGRSSKILSQLWAIHDPSSSKLGQGNEPSLRLRTRSSASVMHDALWVWRERFAKQYNCQRPGLVLTPTPTPAGTVADIPGSSSSSDDMSQSHVTAETANLVNDSNPNFCIEGLGAIWDMNVPWLLPMDLDTYFSREDQQMGLPNFPYSLEADACL